MSVSLYAVVDGAVRILFRAGAKTTVLILFTFRAYIKPVIWSKKD